MLFAESIEQIANKLKANMPEETILVTPTAGEGRRLLNLLAAKGHMIAGVRVETPRSLAREICADFFAKHPMVRIGERNQLRDIMFKTLKRMPEMEFFKKPHAKDRKTSELMFDVIEELDLAGIPNVDGNPRLKALQALREAYKRAKGNICDEADILRLAAKLAEEHFAGNGPYIVTLGNYSYNQPEQNVIRAAAGKKLTVIDLTEPEYVEMPKRYMGSTTGKAEISANLRLAGCRGMETESRFIMRDIIDKGYRAEDCVIVFMNSEYRPLLRTAAELFHMPITISGGVPLTGSDLYYTLLQLRDWTGNDCDAEVLRTLLINGGITVENKGMFLHRLREKNIGWGRGRYYDRFLKPEDGDTETCTPEMIGVWREFIDTLIALSNRESTYCDQQAAMRRFLKYHVAVRNAGEGSALAQVKCIAESVTFIDDDETFLGRVLEMMENGNYLSGREEPGKLFATPLRGAFLTGRKVMYICGMERFCMQNGAMESPIMLDREKELYGLPTMADRERENVFSFYMTLTAHEGDAVLSYCDYDTQRMNGLSPSPEFVNLATNIQTVSYIPEVPMMIGDLAARKELMRAVMGKSSEPGEDILAAQLLQPVGYSEQLESKTFSPSALETALSCPLKFYLQRMIGLYPQRLPERRASKWLEAAEMGTLVHDVLEHYYRPDESRPLQTIFEETVKKIRALRPDSTATAMRSDKKRAMEMIERAIQWTEESGREVVATEQVFGKGRTGDVCVENNEPMALRLGSMDLKISGSIDRVDRLKDGSYAILDYKTGTSASYIGHENMKLQPYLYTLAFEQMNANVEIEDAGYLFLKNGASYLPMQQTADNRTRKVNTVLALLERMRDEEKAQIAAPSFIIGDNGIEGIGSAKDREACLKDCARCCDFIDICTAAEQIMKMKAMEETEGDFNE